MKRGMSLILALLAACALSAQTPQYIYCELVAGTGPILSAKVKIKVDFGQATTLLESTTLKDAEGKPVVFNSMIDAMNWMNADGWEFVQAYVTVTGSKESSTSATHWILRKNIDSLSPEELEGTTKRLNTKR